MTSSTELRVRALQLIRQYQASPTQHNADALERFEQTSTHAKDALDWAWFQLQAISEESGYAYQGRALQSDMEPKSQQRKSSRWLTFLTVITCTCAVVAWQLPKYLEAAEYAKEVTPPPFFEKSSYETERQHKEIRLDDGSILWLDWNTKADVIYTDTSRKVLLHKGRAALKVFSHGSRPFTVKSGTTTTEVSGAEFIMHRHNRHKVHIKALQGSVNVSNATSTLALKTFEEVTVADDLPFASKRIDTSINTSWRQGQLVMRDLTVIEAIELLRPYTSFEVDAIRLANVDGRVSATYALYNADYALQTIIIEHNLYVQQDGWNLRIRPPIPERPTI